MRPGGNDPTVRQPGLSGDGVHPFRIPTKESGFSISGLVEVGGKACGKLRASTEIGDIAGNLGAIPDT